MAGPPPKPIGNSNRIKCGEEEEEEEGAAKATEEIGEKDWCMHANHQANIANKDME